MGIDPQGGFKLRLSYVSLVKRREKGSSKGEGPADCGEGGAGGAFTRNRRCACLRSLDGCGRVRTPSFGQGPSAL